MADPSVMITPEEQALRLARMSGGLKPPMLDPNRVPVAPVAAPDITPTGPGLNTPILGSTAQPTDPRLLPSAFPTPPDLSKIGPRTGFGNHLAEVGLALLGGLPAAESYANAPRTKVIEQYNLQRQSALDQAEQATRESQVAERAASATQEDMVDVPGHPELGQVPKKSLGPVLTAATKAASAEATQQDRDELARELQNAKSETAKEIQAAKDATARQVEKERESAREKQDTFKAAIQKELKGMASGNNKVSAVAQRMADLSKSTLPQIDKLMAETDKVADQLGPARGRWNEFMTGKVGAPNPEFAHYMDEMGFLDSAITLAHSQGRVSNVIFQQFKQMFDTGKQSPENMKEALKVAHEWLSNYAQLGAGGATANNPQNNSPSPNKGISIKRDANGRIIGVE